MKATKEHFEFIANVIANVDDKQNREYLAESVADELAKTNPRFVKARFLFACGARRVD